MTLTTSALGINPKKDRAEPVSSAGGWARTDVPAGIGSLVAGSASAGVGSVSASSSVAASR